LGRARSAELCRLGRSSLNGVGGLFRLLRTLVRSLHGLDPQAVASRMEMDLPSVRPSKIERVARVRIKSSPVARGARTTEALAVLLGWNRDRPADCLGEAQADLCFDPHATGAEVIGL